MTSADRFSLFVVDDSMFERNHSKMVALLSRFKDHATGFCITEVFFKCAKSLLRLQKEFQGSSYDLLVSHTTIVFSRYITVGMATSTKHRQSHLGTLGGLFHLLCDEVSQLDWAIALKPLIDLIQDIAKKANKQITTFIQTQLKQWVAG